MTNYNSLPEFDKELKALSKKYLSLSEDIELFKKLIAILPTGNSRHFNIMHDHEGFCIVKARLFCRYLRGDSMRIIYAYWKKEGRFEFIEVYYKGNKTNEDRERIKRYIKNQQ